LPDIRNVSDNKILLVNGRKKLGSNYNIYFGDEMNNICGAEFMNMIFGLISYTNISEHMICVSDIIKDNSPILDGIVNYTYFGVLNPHTILVFNSTEKKYEIDDTKYLNLLTSITTNLGIEPDVEFVEIIVRKDNTNKVKIFYIVFYSSKFNSNTHIDHIPT